jgi:cytochrome c5
MGSEGIAAHGPSIADASGFAIVRGVFRRLLFPLVVCALCVTAAVACKSSSPSADAGGKVSAIVSMVNGSKKLPDGKILFNQNCATCHGIDGQGAIGPKIGGGAVAAKYTVQQHVTIVVNGRNGMPAWGNSLKTDEIAAIVKYEREKLGR